jgi:hypothetical protein
MSAASQQRVADSFFRRQLLLAAVAAAVVVGGLAAVAVAMARGGANPHASLRPTPGGPVEVVSPLTESFRSATWAALVALVGVAVLLVVLVGHMVRVARFALAEPTDERD